MKLKMPKRIMQYHIDLGRMFNEGRPPNEVQQLWTSPEKVFRGQVVADPWQIECLQSQQDLLLNCSRQVGKSLVTAAIALLTVLRQYPALVLILSPTDRQSQELLKAKFMPLYAPWREICPLVKDNEFTKEFANGSRIIALPGKNEGNIRSYSAVDLLIIDEASRVVDSLYDAVTPMLATSDGRKIVLSTPFGKRGFFWREWSQGIGWKKVEVKASQCPRLSSEYLDGEKAAKGERVFLQEYCCDFSAAAGAVFAEWAIAASLRKGIPPIDLFGDDGLLEADEPEYVDRKGLDLFQ